MQHFGGDFNQIRVQFGLVPLFEHIADLSGVHAEPAVHEIVAFRNELHVRVFDAVVDHLDEVAGTVLADMRDARFAFGDSRDGLEDRAEGLPGFLGAAGHEGRAVERAFLAAGHAAADEVKTASANLLLAADGVLEVGVATVDDDVARFHGVGELVDHRVGRGARLNHDDRGARTLERGDELFDGLRGHELAFVAVLVDELFRALVMPVVHGDGVPVMRQVAGEVGAHCRQSDDADVCCSFYGHYVTFPKSDDTFGDTSAANPPPTLAASLSRALGGASGPFHEYALSDIAVGSSVCCDLSSPDGVFVGYLTFHPPFRLESTTSSRTPEPFCRLC